MRAKQMSATALALVVAACEGLDPMAPDDLNPAFLWVPDVMAGEVLLCSEVPTFETFSFDLTNISNFSLSVGNPVWVFGGDCASLGLTASGTGSITITQPPVSGYQGQKVEVYRFTASGGNTSGQPTLISSTTPSPLSATVAPSTADGFVVVFYNAEGPPPPPPGPTDPGCVRGLGFWKNHEGQWPATHSPAAPFATGTASWMKTLWTMPMKGNAYIILAHHYISAVLNDADGALVPAHVQAALDGAGSYFATARWGSDPGGSMRAQMLQWADLLSDFNSGWEGVPSCPD